MITPVLHKKAIVQLQKCDPILGKIITTAPDLTWSDNKDYFVALSSEIISQQLSIKVANVIYARFVALFPNEQLTPEKVLAIDTEAIRKIGVSYGKISYLKDLARHVIESPKMFETFDTMSDEEIITELTKVKGIGRWTAEMFLMFTMHRPDVFSYGDLAIRKAIKNLYGLEKEPTKEEGEQISSVWKPYRTIACRYLWKSLTM